MGIAHLSSSSTASAFSILARALQDMPHLIDPSRPAGQALALVSPGPGKTAHQAPLPPLRSKKAEYNNHRISTLRHLNLLDSTRMVPCPGRCASSCRIT